MQTINEKGDEKEIGKFIVVKFSDFIKDGAPAYLEKLDPEANKKGSNN